MGKFRAGRNKWEGYAGLPVDCPGVVPVVRELCVGCSWVE